MSGQVGSARIVNLSNLAHAGAQRSREGKSVHIRGSGSEADTIDQHADGRRGLLGYCGANQLVRGFTTLSDWQAIGSPRHPGFS